jgi:hypothetical protein
MPSEETPQRRRLWFSYDELYERRRIQIHRHCGPRLIREREAIARAPASSLVVARHSRHHA